MWFLVHFTCLYESFRDKGTTMIKTKMYLLIMLTSSALIQGVMGEGDILSSEIHAQLSNRKLENDFPGSNYKPPTPSREDVKKAVDHRQITKTQEKNKKN